MKLSRISRTILASPSSSQKRGFKLESPLDLEGFRFSRLSLNAKGDSLIGPDDTDAFFVKIGLEKNPRKLRSVLEESRVVEDLSSKGAVSCPSFVARGTISSDKIVSQSWSGPGGVGQLSYFIMRKLLPLKRWELGDLVLAMIEQQQLGWFQGDIKPSNLALDPATGALVLVDYDQAIELEPEEISMDNLSFLNWTFENENRRFGHDDWLRHFGGSISKAKLFSLFRDGSLNLAFTSLYKAQRTTNTKTGIYHTVRNARVFADGVRAIDDRIAILDEIHFDRNEKVLDVGCNVGLLSHYLYDRGCKVYGFEIDRFIVAAASMIANILGMKITFQAADLDHIEFEDDFDTVMLFSVFHHTKNLVANGKKIAEASKRIIIECRLVESGKKPNPGSRRWDTASKWDYESLDALYKGLEAYFPKFKVTKNFGLVDKKRYVVELKKTLVPDV